MKSRKDVGYRIRLSEKERNVFKISFKMSTIREVHFKIKRNVTSKKIKSKTLLRVEDKINQSEKLALPIVLKIK
jgi:hypothetical protein